MKYKLIINFKTYEESFDEKAINIAKIAKKLQKKANSLDVDIILCPNAYDIKDLIKIYPFIYSQHIDEFPSGANTGFQIPKLLKNLGIKGTLISHSEHQLSNIEIEKRINISKQLGIETCVCARNSKKVEELVKFNPSFIALEPKELIGGDISISKAKPKLIIDALKVSKNIPLLVGAGVKDKEDVKKAIELGAMGILVASGIVKAKNIEEAILDILKGFEK